MDTEQIERELGYRFNDVELLKRALTHPSYCLENPSDKGHNQQLEFLGDAVISLVLAEWLFTDYPEEREGWLTKARSAMAKGKALSQIAESLGVADWVRISKGESANRRRGYQSMLEDAFEALAGAIFVDSDFETTKAIILTWFAELRPTLGSALVEDNPKGRLQEITQSSKPAGIPNYEIIEEKGPDHNKQFIANVSVFDKSIGRGKGSSKKEAEEDAARAALENQKSEDSEAS